MTIKAYRKTAIMYAVQYDGTAENAEEIIDFMREKRGVLRDENGAEVGRREAGMIALRGQRTFRTGGISDAQMDAAKVLFDDPEVTAVIWNDLHKYWNPLRVTDHTALDSQGAFYPISQTDVEGSYVEILDDERSATTS